jgi:hypothetical protein
MLLYTDHEKFLSSEQWWPCTPQLLWMVTKVVFSKYFTSLFCTVTANSCIRIRQSGGNNQDIPTSPLHTYRASDNLHVHSLTHLSIRGHDTFKLLCPPWFGMLIQEQYRKDMSHYSWSTPIRKTTYTAKNKLINYKLRLVTKTSVY